MNCIVCMGPLNRLCGHCVQVSICKDKTNMQIVQSETTLEMQVSLDGFESSLILYNPATNIQGNVEFQTLKRL